MFHSHRTLAANRIHVHEPADIQFGPRCGVDIDSSRCDSAALSHRPAASTITIMLADLSLSVCVGSVPPQNDVAVCVMRI